MLCSIGFIAKHYGVSPSTIRRWVKLGYIRIVCRTFGGHRRFEVPNDVSSEQASTRKHIGYARVSSHDQKEDLSRQSARLREAGCEEVIEDIGSGLNCSKPGLRSLLRQLLDGRVRKLSVVHEDRLLRFGVGLIRQICRRMRTEVDVLESRAEKTFEEELARVSAVLVGCATSTPSAVKQGTYNEKLSRAKNLADPFGYTVLRDAQVPEGANISPDGSLLLDTAGWAANLHLAARTGFLPGTNDWGSALAWGLGFSLLSSAFAPTPLTEKHAAFGYVPASKASSVVEARNLFAKQWADAMAATLRDLYPKAKIETDFADYKKTMLMDAFYVGAVSIVDESMGCFGYEVKRPPRRSLHRKRCRVHAKREALNASGIPGRFD